MDTSFALPVNPTIENALAFDRMQGKELLDDSNEISLPGWAAKPLRRLLWLHEALNQYSTSRTPELPFDHCAEELLARAKAVTEVGLKTRLEEDGYFRFLREAEDLFCQAEPMRAALLDYILHPPVVPTSYLNPKTDLCASTLQSAATVLSEAYESKKDRQLLCVYRSFTEAT